MVIMAWGVRVLAVMGFRVSGELTARVIRVLAAMGFRVSGELTARVIRGARRGWEFTMVRWMLGNGVS